MRAGFKSSGLKVIVEAYLMIDEKSERSPS